MQTGQVPAEFNHGGHEMFDVHEMFSGLTAMLSAYGPAQNQPPLQ